MSEILEVAPAIVLASEPRRNAVTEPSNEILAEQASEPAPGLSLPKIVALAVVLVIVLLVGAVWLLGGSSLLPFNYEGF
jgi:hypothetical protein